MGGLLEFAGRFGTEERCIEQLALLRWPGGFVCAGCGGRQAWRLKARPRVYECAACHRQESVTAGTVFHRTRTELPKWFLAAYLMGRDKRGVSAKFLQRELGVAYQTAWTMAHKLRHGLSDDPARPSRGFLEADETFIGGRRDPHSRGRSTQNPNNSLVVAAVEKVPAPNDKKGHAVNRQHGFFAGDARIAVLPAASGAELGAFVKANVAAGSHLLTDGFAGYCGQDADLGEHLKHTAIVQDHRANAGKFFPIVHTLFSNLKAWLAGTHHVPAPTTASAPSTCRATCGNGLTASTAATRSTAWTAI
jgi:transposase-like protein